MNKKMSPEQYNAQQVVYDSIDLTLLFSLLKCCRKYYF